VRFTKRLSLALLTALLGLAALLAAVSGAFSAAAQRPSLTKAAHARAPVLSVVAEPSAGLAPFLNLIGHARHTIELTMYELYNTRIESALVAAAKRGVDVRVLLNGGYYGNAEFKGSDRNGPAYAYLRAHRVNVHWTPGYFALTHQKTMTVDGSVSAVMTLNFDGNLATTRDFAVLDRRPGDVHAIVAGFDADWSGKKRRASDGSGDLIWSPGSAKPFESMIGSAHRSLDIENEELDDAPITSDLCDAARRGVAVHLVMSYDSEWSSSFAQLRRGGVTVHLFHGQSYYIHAKLMIADGRRAIVSSQNFSYTSLYENRELGIRITAHGPVSMLARDFNADFRRG
jgi:cardiolipin synthase A/B